jgi:hypothetical protein
MSSPPWQSSFRVHPVGPSNRCVDHSPDLRFGVEPGVGRPNPDTASSAADSRISAANDSLPNDAISSTGSSAEPDSALAAALSSMIRVINENRAPSPTQQVAPPPSSLDLLRLLMAGHPSSPPANSPAPASLPEPFAFSAQRATSLSPTSGPIPARVIRDRVRARPAARHVPALPSSSDPISSSARRRARAQRRAEHRAVVLYVTHLPDAATPDGANQLKRARHTPPAPARDAHREDCSWLHPSSPAWGDSQSMDNLTTPVASRRPRPSTPPGSLPDAWPSPDPVPAGVHDYRDTLEGLHSDPRHDFSTWPSHPPTSPTWAPWDPPPAYVPVPPELLQGLRLDAPCSSPPSGTHTDASLPIGHNQALERIPINAGKASTPYSLTDQDVAFLLRPDAEDTCEPWHSGFPPPRRPSSPCPPLLRPVGDTSAPPPSTPAPARPGWYSAQPSRTPAGHDGADAATPGHGWQAVRAAVLVEITAFVHATAAQWETEHDALLADVTLLRLEVAGSSHSPPGNAKARQAVDNYARSLQIHSTVSLLNSERKTYRDALERAIIELDAADTPARAATAINVARSFLSAPAPGLTSLTRPAPNMAQQPTPLHGDPATVISGNLQFPDNLPCAAARPSPRTDRHDRAPVTFGPYWHPTPSLHPTPRGGLVARSTLLPDPAALRWASRHRSVNSARPAPSRPDLRLGSLPAKDTSPAASSGPGVGHLDAVDVHRPPWRRLVLDARPLPDESPTGSLSAPARPGAPPLRGTGPLCPPGRLYP